MPLLPSVPFKSTCVGLVNLFPVHQIFTVEYRYSGEVLERAVDEIEVITGTAYAGIGVEARKHGISESLSTNTERL